MSSHNSYLSPSHFSEKISSPLSDVKDYWHLTKPRVMSLVLFTGFVALLSLPVLPSLFESFLILLGLSLSAAGSGALNMAFENLTDAKMSRTCDRPVPSGRISQENALAFGIFLNGLSLLIYGLGISWESTIFLGFTSFFYVVIYTLLLKPHTDQNIVIGGLAGALPPVIAWYAGGGDFFAFKPWFMVSLIFLWTPPHFWALALLRKEEYQKAQFPMLPLTKGEKYTKSAIMAYTLGVVLWSFSPCLLQNVGNIYKIGNTFLAGLFFYKAIILFKQKNKQDLGSFFGFSIFYLFGEFSLLLWEWGVK